MNEESKKRDLIHGSRPAHQHHNRDGDFWQCNSPYCEDPQFPTDHPDDGGPHPVLQGYEPWRGR